jgi:hypothetical protein
MLFPSLKWDLELEDLKLGVMPRALLVPLHLPLVPTLELPFFLFVGSASVFGFAYIAAA